MHEGHVEGAHGRTWYRVHGTLDPHAAQVPAVVLHGGPGAASDYTWPIAELLHESGRTTVVYDQLGCGRSTHLPDAPPGFWTPRLFLDELRSVLDHLGLTSRHALVGHSWGGMLAMEWALEQPPGLVSLVLCDAPASMPLWVQEAERLRSLLPDRTQEALRRHEEAGTTDSLQYVRAVRVFQDLHVCRAKPLPAVVHASFDQLADDPTVYHAMNGPSDFHVVGSLRDWDVTHRLHEITVPTLLVSGEHDQATPRVVGSVHERIPGSEWALLDDASHMPQVEQPEQFRDAVATFLARHD